jgi:hypothetical protein
VAQSGTALDLSDSLRIAKSPTNPVSFGISQFKNQSESLMILLCLKVWALALGDLNGHHPFFMKMLP